MFGYQEVVIRETGTQFSGFVHLWVSSFLHVCGWNQWPEDWFKNASSSLGGLCYPYIQCYILFFLLHGLSMAVKPPVGWQSSLCGRQVAWARGLHCSTLETPIVLQPCEFPCCWMVFYTPSPVISWCCGGGLPLVGEVWRVCWICEEEVSGGQVETWGGLDGFFCVNIQCIYTFQS